MGPAITAGAANRRTLNLTKTPLAWMATDDTAAAMVLLAAGELLFDKLPFGHHRMRTMSLATRFLAGAICAFAITNGRKPYEKIMGAMVGGTAAVAAACVGYEYRRHAKLPALAKALIEDTVAVGAANAVVTHVCA